MAEIIEDTGACRCRSVKFKAKGNVMFNALCHCKACSHNRGMSPVHLIGVGGADSVEILEGAELVTTAKGPGSIVREFCSKCGVSLWQGPEGAPFRAIFPTNFHIEDGVVCKLTEKYLPKAHINYENRHYDWCDKLPKFKCFPDSPMMDNEGKLLRK